MEIFEEMEPKFAKEKKRINKIESRRKTHHFKSLFTITSFRDTKKNGRFD
jgi:hypothetical protein